jgi:nucleoside-diphosphate-sugar epimerase
VAGGAGFIGTNLCERLLAEGDEVICVDNMATGRQRNMQALFDHPTFEFIEADLIEGVPAVSRVDEVYNLASPASPPGYQRIALETLRVNSEGTRHLLDVAVSAGARFLYTSTSEAYGDPLEHPQVESYRGNVSTTGPRSMYDEAKRFGEAMVAHYWTDRGADARIVRIFNTYGPHSDPLDGRIVPNFITQALRGEPLTVYDSGEQTRSLCYVSDLVDGLIRAMRTPAARGEVTNLGNPEEHTVLEYAELIIELTQSGSPIKYVPAAVGDDPQRRRPDIAKAQRLLGWQPVVRLRDGLTRTIRYFENELAAIGTNPPR